MATQITSGSKHPYQRGTRREREQDISANNLSSGPSHSKRRKMDGRAASLSDADLYMRHVIIEGEDPVISNKVRNVAEIIQVTVKIKEKQIESLQNEVDRLESEVSDTAKKHNAELKKKNKEIDTLKKKIETLEQEIAAQEENKQETLTLEKKLKESKIREHKTAEYLSHICFSLASYPQIVKMATISIQLLDKCHKCKLPIINEKPCYHSRVMDVEVEPLQCPLRFHQKCLKRLIDKQGVTCDSCHDTLHTEDTNNLFFGVNKHKVNVSILTVDSSHSDSRNECIKAFKSLPDEIQETILAEAANKYQTPSGKGKSSKKTVKPKIDSDYSSSSESEAASSDSEQEESSSDED